ncbi:hypothetical protein JQ615_31025 [Bradyrhizobium jicamae]|uniref:Uncharacterized protein n=1 Tax=Bradyrhizobium jicamae TaxID=280332 RepID=A0ABS5FST6_9BRAD|nr:hypothetical protein [Bradyrhizobium jicamae]MBR0799813.1 hypothetical protein [Bradyrhizobium jicamae]
MEATIIGQFDTRRGAELAVEHVVQECGVPRVFVQPVGKTNSSGARAAGTDRKAAPEPETNQKLDGAIEVSVDFHGDGPKRIADALQGVGAKHVRTK